MSLLAVSPFEAQLSTPAPAAARRFEVVLDVAAAPHRAWEVMSDVRRWPLWNDAVSSVTMVDNPRIAVGSRVLIEQPKFPPALWKVTAIEPGRGFTWVSVAPGLRVIGRHSIEPTEEGCRVTLAIEMHGLLGGLWARLTGRITRRYIAMEASGLKARSEGPGDLRP